MPQAAEVQFTPVQLRFSEWDTQRIKPLPGQSFKRPQDVLLASQASISLSRYVTFWIAPQEWENKPLETQYGVKLDGYG